MKLAGVLRFFAFFWVIVLSLAVVEYLGFKPDTGFLKLKQAAVKSGWYLPAFYSHIFGSGIILICGFFQFNGKISLKIHKALGRIYVYGILFFAAPGGFVMTFFINRGTPVLLSFLFQNLLWVIFTIGTIISIKKQDVENHSAMAIRSYSLAFAAVTLRFYIWLFHIFGTGTSFENNYVIIALLSWIPNLIIAEWVIKRKIYAASRRRW